MLIFCSDFIGTNPIQTFLPFHSAPDSWICSWLDEPEEEEAKSTISSCKWSWVWKRKTFPSDLKDANKFEDKLAKEIYRDFYTLLGWNSDKKL